MTTNEIKLDSEIKLIIILLKDVDNDINNKKIILDLFNKNYNIIVKSLSVFIELYSKDQIVELIESVISLVDKERSLNSKLDKLIKIYFDLDPDKNSYFIKALLLKAEINNNYIEEFSVSNNETNNKDKLNLTFDINNFKGENLLEKLKSPINYILRAIEIINSKNEYKIKYGYLIYNASLLIFKLFKKYFKQNFYFKHFCELLERVSIFLEESNDVDYSWRIRLLLRLTAAYIDSDKKAESVKVLDKVTDLVKKINNLDENICNNNVYLNNLVSNKESFLIEVFKLRVHYLKDNQAALSNLKKEADALGDTKPYKYIYYAQAIKSQAISEQNIEKELQIFLTSACHDYFKIINDPISKVNIDSYKADAIAECAFNIILVYNKKIFTSLNRDSNTFTSSLNLLNTVHTMYSFLSRCRSNSIIGNIMIDNIKSLIILNDLEKDLISNPLPESEASQKRILIRLQSLEMLEKSITSSLREYNLELLNDTSYLVFNTAIPFFKKSLRQNIIKVFYTTVEALSQVESNEHLLRVYLHYELAKAYIEGDLLQEALNQINKALVIDYSIPLSKININNNNSAAVINNKDKTKNKKDDATLISDKNKELLNTSYIMSATSEDEHIACNMLQRNLDQYLLYIKRYCSVKIDIYSDKTDVIDQLIVEEDKLKSYYNKNIQNKDAKDLNNSALKKDLFNKCLSLIEDYKITEFDENDYRKYLVDNTSYTVKDGSIDSLPFNDNFKKNFISYNILNNKDLVEEELNTLKLIYKYNIINDKKHFTQISTSICKLAYDCQEYITALAIYKAVIEDNKIQSKWNFKYDPEEISANALIYIIAAKCYEKFLSQESIEVGTNNIINYSENIEIDINDISNSNRYTSIEIEKFEEWKAKFIKNLQTANRLATSVSSYWLSFNIATVLWNTYLPIIKAENCIVIIYNNVLNLLLDLYESLNNAFIYFEFQANSEVNDNEFYTKLELFCNIASFYCKLCEGKSQEDECIRVCDAMLGRKINSNYRKIFDQLKSRAIKSLENNKDKTNKKQLNNSNANNNKKKDLNNYVNNPSNSQLIISDCFSLLELALISSDNKQKYDILKKGFDNLKEYKIDFDDNFSLELIAELWYKYGSQLYSLNSYETSKLSVLCAENCVKQFNKIDLNIIKQLYSNDYYTKSTNNFSYKDDPKYRVLKWYSVGFLLYGDSLLSLINEEKQERKSQIKLYYIIINKYLLSAEIAEQTKEYFVILQNIKAFYNVVICIIENAECRENLLTFFSKFHKMLVSNRVQLLYSDPEFLLLFYSMYSQSIIQTKNWNLGEQVISDALKMLHTSKHHFLLEYKLLFSSNLNKNFIQQLSSLDDKDIISKSKLYSKLARCSNSKSEQFSSYCKAIEILKNDNNIYAVDCIVELCSWLYKNNYPSVDIENHLLQAADYLLEIEPLFDNDEDLEEDGVTVITKRSGASRLSRMSKNSKIKSDNSKNTKNKSKISSKVNNKSNKRNYSIKSNRTKTVFSKLSPLEPYPVYLNILHLSKLFCIHVQLSQLSYEDSFNKNTNKNENISNKELEYLLDSFYFLTKMQETSFKTLNCLLFYDNCKEDIFKLNLDINNPICSLVDYYYTSKELNINQIYSYPDNIEDIILFEYPEVYIRKIKEFDEPSYFSKSAFNNPDYFVNNLIILIDKFSKEYFFHSKLVVCLKFAVLFAEHILNNKVITSYFKLKLIQLYHNIINVDLLNNDDNKLNFLKEVLYNNNNTIVKSTNNKDNKTNNDKINNEIQQSSLVSSYNIKDLVFPLNSDICIREREKLKKFNTDLLQDDNFVRNQGYDLTKNNKEVLFITNNPIRLDWYYYSEVLITFGYIVEAKDYLTECLFHCRIYKDYKLFTKSNILYTNLLFLNGNYNDAFNNVNYIQTFTCLSKNNLYDVINLVYFMLSSFKKYDDIIVLINNYHEVLNKLEAFDNNSNNNNNKLIYTNYSNLRGKLYLYNAIICLKKLCENENKTSNKNNVIEYNNNNINNSLKKPNNKINSVNNIISTANNNITNKSNNNNLTSTKNNFSNQLAIESEINNQKINVYFTYENLVIPLLDKYSSINYHISMSDIDIIIQIINYSVFILTNNQCFVYINDDELHLSIKILEVCCKYLSKISKYLTNIQTFIPVKLDNKQLSFPLYRLIAKTKILYSKINNFIGEFKAKIKKLFRESVDKENKEKYVDLGPEIIEYINNLTIELEYNDKNNKNNSNTNNADNNTNTLNRYEKSIATLVTLDLLIPDYVSDYISYTVEKINSYRLQSMNSKELINIWNIKMLEYIIKKDKTEKTEDTLLVASEKDKYSDINNNTIINYKVPPKEFHQKSLNIIEKFIKDKIDTKLISANLEYSQKANSNMSKLYLYVLELSGYYNIELSISALLYYQNYIIKDFYSKTIDKYTDVKNKDFSSKLAYSYSRYLFQYNTDISCLSLNNHLNDSLNFISKFSYNKNIINHTSWNECKSLLCNYNKDLTSNNSIFLFQMNEDRTCLYVGFIILSSIENNYIKEQYIRKIPINREINEKLDNCLYTIKQIKHLLIKSVIVTKNDLNKHFDNINSDIKKSVTIIEDIFSSIWTELNTLINSLKKDTNNNNENTTNNDKKTNIQNDKTNKDKNNNINKNADSVINVESILFLIDNRFYELPFDSLYCFNSIPLKTNDLSLQTYVNRIENFNKNVINNKINYFLDYPDNIISEFKNNNKKQDNNNNFLYSNKESLSLNPYDLINSFNNKSNANNSKGVKEVKEQNNTTALSYLSNQIVGVFKNDRTPSLGEFQRIFSDSFIYLSQTSFLYNFQPNKIIELSSISNTNKIIICLDRIATIKENVNQNSLIPKNYSFSSMPLDIIALFTLQNSSVILTTKWSIDFYSATEILGFISKEGRLNNIGTAVNSFKTSKNININDITTNYDNTNNNKNTNKNKKLNNKLENLDSNINSLNASDINKEREEVFRYSLGIWGLYNVKIQ